MEISAKSIQKQKEKEEIIKAKQKAIKEAILWLWSRIPHFCEQLDNYKLDGVCPPGYIQCYICRQRFDVPDYALWLNIRNDTGGIYYCIEIGDRIMHLQGCIKYDPRKERFELYCYYHPKHKVHYFNFQDNAFIKTLIEGIALNKKVDDLYHDLDALAPPLKIFVFFKKIKKLFTKNPNQ
ncbi:MAG: hypothetical protein WCW02_02725 [Candidatus Buchananbacteria bacterium]